MIQGNMFEDNSTVRISQNVHFWHFRSLCYGNESSKCLIIKVTNYFIEPILERNLKKN